MHRWLALAPHSSMAHPRRVTRTLASSLVCAVAVSSSALAQTSAPDLPHSGSRVRVWTDSSAPPFTAYVDAFRGDSLSLIGAGTGGPRVLHLRDITRLDVHRRGSAAATAGLIAGTVGALTGAGVYLNWCSNNRDACRANERRSDSTDVAYDRSVDVGGALVIGGTLLGAGLGYFLAPSQWETVALPVRLSIAPLRGGVVVAAIVRFGGP